MREKKALILLIFALFLGSIFNCANKSTSIKLSGNHNKNQNISVKQIYISSTKDKTLIVVPIKKEIFFSYYYSFPNLTIKFSMPIENLKLPVNFEKNVINYVKFVNSSTLLIRLKKDVQFVILRDKPERLKIILIPQKDSSSSSKKEITQNKNSLRYIKFYKDEENNLYILLKADKKFTYKFLKTKKKQLKLFFPSLFVPLKYRKLYNLSKFETVLKSVLVENSKKGGILTFYFLKRVPLDIQKEDNWMKICVSKIWLSLIKSKNKPSEVKQTESVKNASEASTTIILPGMKKKFTGTPISIDLQDADVAHVLRLLSEIGKFNLVLDESVKGKVTLKLKNTPWDQVLDLILLQKNLGMIKQGNIVRIAPLKKLKEEQERIVAAREALLKAQKSKEKLAPLKVEYIQINYATASSIINQLKSFVSPRGKINYDSRTNQIIVYDTEENIKKIKSVIRKLDRPQRQVLIEARIVYATDSFQRTLGIKWGGGVSSFATRHGNTIGYGLYGSQEDLNEKVTDSEPLKLSDNLSELPSGYMVNLPNSGYLGLGWYVAKLTGKDFFALNAELTLGETKGLVKTISSPRIVTLNNQEAEVVQGTKIATKTESESGGTTTEYVEATLKLSVTPQITPDNKLILTLEISDDSPVPGGEDIETRRASTRLIVNDGETIVIGGVQKITESETYNKVPGLADIPFLGWLFKSKTKIKNKNELLIFIRPKIL